MSLSKGQRLLLLGVLLVVIDQVIKILVKTNMTLGQSISVFGDWFQILFVENKGMAFGMSFGGVIGKYILTAFRIGLFAVLCWWIGKLCRRATLRLVEHPEEESVSITPGEEATPAKETARSVS